MRRWYVTTYGESHGQQDAPAVRGEENPREEAPRQNPEVGPDGQGEVLMGCPCRNRVPVPPPPPPPPVTPLNPS